MEIVLFDESYQTGIDKLFRDIQSEFPQQVFPDGAKTIKELSKENNRVYWVALSCGVVIGTVGIILLENKICALKSMFLAKSFRGDSRQIAKQLLQTAIDRAISDKCSYMYLGTMEQFTSAQQFYEKHGFEQVSAEALPADFPSNTVDTIFYRKLL